MKLLPVDIEQKEFSKGFSGYNKAEVRAFLDEVARQMAELSSELRQVREMEQSLTSQIKTQDELTNREDLIKRTLIQAEKHSEGMVSNAVKEAENLLAEAKVTAKKIVDDANFSAKKSLEEARNYLHILEQEYYKVREEKRQFVMRFKAELEVLLNRVSDDPILKEKPQAPTPVKGEDNAQ